MGENLRTMQENKGNLDKSARLKTLLAALKLSGAAFGARLGYSKTAISQIISGVRSVSDGFVYRLSAKFPEVNIEWLLNGNGEMFLAEGITVSTVSEPAPTVRTEKEFQELEAEVARLARELEEQKKISAQLAESILNITKSK